MKLWREFPQKLARLTGCNLLIYDRQGYGESEPIRTTRENNYLEVEADNLHSLMAKLKLRDVILFGHSDGGSISLIAASKYPETIRGIITEGAHIFVEEITLEGIQKAEEQFLKTDLEERLKKYHGEKTSSMFDAWTKTWLSESFRSWNIEHYLAGIKCPSLIIQGEKDEFGSLDQVNGIISQVSGRAEKLVIPDIGHSPHKEAAEVVLSHSAQFIRSL